MKSSTPEPTQSHPPLGEKTPPPLSPNPSETWRPHPTNKNLEVNDRGQFRTRLPLPWLENL